VFKILKKEVLNPQVVKMDILAPRIAKKAKAGQFIILRVNENGERIPLTIADYNRDKGTITIIFQIVGKTTQLLSEQDEGGYISDFAGPLGKASEYENVKRAVVVGGGLGCAIAYPQAKTLYKMGAEVDMIAGFKNKDLVILEDEMRAACTRLHLMTDDGSYGEQGFVTVKLEEILSKDSNYDVVIAIGPLVMMKFVSAVTKKFNVKTIVSMNPIMIDGTGMCGGCRLTVDGKTKFACVDGPDFDGHLVNFDEAIRRTQIYKGYETESLNKHKCKLEGMR